MGGERCGWSSSRFVLFSKVLYFSYLSYLRGLNPRDICAVLLYSLLACEEVSCGFSCSLGILRERLRIGDAVKVIVLVVVAVGMIETALAPSKETVMEIAGVFPCYTTFMEELCVTIKVTFICNRS